MDCLTTVRKNNSLVMRKSVFAICKQQKCRSACASTQSVSTLVVHCIDSVISLVSISEISRLASFCGCAGRFESYLVKNPKTGFLMMRLKCTREFSYLKQQQLELRRGIVALLGNLFLCKFSSHLLAHNKVHFS